MPHITGADEPYRDPLGKMRVYQLARALVPDSNEDAKLLRADAITKELSGQLHAAVCSSPQTSAKGIPAVRDATVRESSNTPGLRARKHRMVSLERADHRKGDRHQALGAPVGNAPNASCNHPAGAWPTDEMIW